MSSKRAADFLERVQRSGLVAAERLAQSLETLAQRGVDVDNPKAIADALVDDETLTRWQADNLLQGKHKGFFVGSYRLLKPLGKGGMGTVYLAQHEMMRRRCAVKVLPQTQLHEGSSMLGRFYVEAQAVAAMDHQNIVRAYDVNKESKDNKVIHYLVMEYVDGQDIESMVQTYGPLDFVTAADYLRQTANGLAHAHESGLIHRDIKPANLLVDRKGVVKILDLGLARFFDDSGQASLTAAHNEGVLGTADYLSPEQALDSHKVDHRTDLYSLGCTGYFMLTGRPPFNEGSVAQRLVAHQIKEPDPISQERRDSPRDLVAIIEKMMAKNVADRYENANAVSTVLAAWLLEHGGEDWRRQHADIASEAPPSLRQREPTRAMTSPTSETELELVPLDDDQATSSGSESGDSKAGGQGLPSRTPGSEAGRSRVGLPQVSSKPGSEAGKSRVGLPQMGSKPVSEAGKSRVGLPQVGSKPGSEAGKSRVGLPQMGSKPVSEAGKSRVGLPQMGSKPVSEAGKSRVGLPQMGSKPVSEAGKSRVGLPQMGSKPVSEAGKSRVGLPQVGGKPKTEAGSRGEATVAKTKSTPPTARGKTRPASPTPSRLDRRQAAEPLSEPENLDPLATLGNPDLLGTLDSVDLMGATDSAASLASVGDDWLKAPTPSSSLAAPARRSEPSKGIVASIGLPILIGGACALLLLVLILVIVFTRSSGAPSTSPQQTVNPPAVAPTQSPLPTPELTQKPPASGTSPGTNLPNPVETSGPAVRPVAPPPAASSGQEVGKKNGTPRPDSPSSGSPPNSASQPIASSNLAPNPQLQPAAPNANPPPNTNPPPGDTKVMPSPPPAVASPAQPEVGPGPAATPSPPVSATNPPSPSLPVPEASEDQIRDLLAGMREIAIEFKADEKIHEKVSKMVETKIKESVATLGLKISRDCAAVMRVNLTGKQDKGSVVFRLSAEVDCPAGPTPVKVWSNDKELGKSLTQGMAPDAVFKVLRGEVSDFVAPFLRDYRKAGGAKRG